MLDAAYTLDGCEDSWENISEQFLMSVVSMAGALAVYAMCVERG